MVDTITIVSLYIRKSNRKVKNLPNVQQKVIRQEPEAGLWSVDSELHINHQHASWHLRVIQSSGLTFPINIQINGKSLNN
jgi:hypothetical protein